MKTIKMCGVLVHFPFEPYPQQLSITQTMIRAFTRMQNGAVEIPTGCGKTVALLCSAMGFQVDQRYKLLELLEKDDTMWEVSITTDYSRMPNSPGRADVSVSDASSSVKNDTLWFAASTFASNSSPASTTTASSSAVTKTASVFGGEDDDDFVTQPRHRSKRALKKPRRDCGDGACCSSPCGSGGDSGSRSGLVPGAGSVSGSSCLADIEDAHVPVSLTPRASPPTERKEKKWVDENVGCNGDVGAAEVEVIDLVSNPSSCDNSSDATDVESTPTTQEMLTQSLFSDEEDEWKGAGGFSISRDMVRMALRERTRQPNPAGEYGPTRRLAPPRSRAPLRIPKIFYVSRTHLQLEQVASEIKNTCYRDARVVVLSSREFTCVNDNEFRRGRYSNRTEMCRELLNDIPDTDLSWSDVQNMKHLEQSSLKTSCYYYRNGKQYEGHDKMEGINVGPVVDIESLVRAGRKHKFCPYFAARNLVSTADMILCPVNYLIDPLIRKSMDIKLKGEIIIVDEAHMLEDACRETASITVPISDLKECLDDCITLAGRGQLPVSHTAMASSLEALTMWIETNSKKSFSYGFNKDREFSLSSVDLIASLEHSNVNKEVVSKFAEGLEEALKHKKEVYLNESKAYAFFKVISSKTERICERLAMILNFLFRYPEDYVGSITLSSEFEPGRSFQSQAEQEWSVKLVCQNSGLIFRMLSSEAYSIIFSSATLSPIRAFAAELGVEIQYSVTRGHVIPETQTWIGCLGRSERGYDLYGKYGNTKSVEYMDEIGKIVLDICCRVPYGVLVFVTSYWILDKIIQRWKDTNLWEKIAEHKRPLGEKRNGKDFNEVLRNFYCSVEDAQRALASGLVTVGNGCTGPLLVAVMRGKVSEGFNFADDKTRAIISVGIPYPNIYENTIRWKREYNKLHSIQRPLEDAEGWYNTQAFR